MTADAPKTTKTQRLSIFPLAGVLLFPRLQVPLHIFEPRYRALVSDAMARDRRIAMIQPRDMAQVPALFEQGCVGHITDVEALDDGRYNIVLTGVARFRMIRELPVKTAFRQIEAEILDNGDADEGVLPSVIRASVEQEAKRFAKRAGYAVDWDAVGRLDDEALINGIAQIAPFDTAAKQALFEAPTLDARTELIIQMLQFFGRRDDDGAATLQ